MITNTKEKVAMFKKNKKKTTKNTIKQMKKNKKHCGPNKDLIVSLQKKVSLYAK
jgi:hypothetical protein